MSKLSWDSQSRSYEFGLDRGVFYPQTGSGVAWNGLKSISEIPDGVKTEGRYFDGIKIPRRKFPEFFSGSIQAITYPDGLLNNSPFGLSYRTRSADRYRIHLIYNVLIEPSSKSYSVDPAIEFDWNFTTKPVLIADAAPTAHLIIDSSISYSWTLSAIENLLYGSNDNEPRLPSPQEIFDLIDSNAILQIVDHGDGSWTAIGPDEVVSMVDSTTFQIDWPSVVMLNSYTYTVRSL